MTLILHAELADDGNGGVIGGSYLYSVEHGLNVRPAHPNSYQPARISESHQGQRPLIITTMTCCGTGGDSATLDRASGEVLGISFGAE